VQCAVKRFVLLYVFFPRFPFLSITNSLTYYHRSFQTFLRPSKLLFRTGDINTEREIAVDGWTQSYSLHNAARTVSDFVGAPFYSQYDSNADVDIVSTWVVQVSLSMLARGDHIEVIEDALGTKLHGYLPHNAFKLHASKGVALKVSECSILYFGLYEILIFPLFPRLVFPTTLHILIILAMLRRGYLSHLACPIHQSPYPLIFVFLPYVRLLISKE